MLGGRAAVDAVRIPPIRGMVEMLPRSLHPGEARGTEHARSAAANSAAAPVGMTRRGTENPRAARLPSCGVQAGTGRVRERRPPLTAAATKARKEEEARLIVLLLGKPGRRVGASHGAETGVLAGGAKFEGTCPFVQVILVRSEPAVRGCTQPSRSHGAEPECQL